MKLPIGRILGGVGKTLATIAITAAAQALADAAAKRIARQAKPTEIR